MPELRDLERDAWKAPGGFPWPPVVLLGVVVLISVVVVGWRATRPEATGPKVLSDVAFVDAANATCREAFPALRPQATSRDDRISIEQAAERAERAADGLGQLAGRLRALPVAAEQRPFVEGWLDDWATFAAAGRSYATAVRKGDIEAADATGKAGDPAQRRADAFARGNGLRDCRLQVAVRAPEGRGGAF